MICLSGINDGRRAVSACVSRLTSEQINDIRHTDVLFIDEVSMLSMFMFRKMEAVLRAVRGEGTPFGGIQVVLCGDFLQLQPVPNKR